MNKNLFKFINLCLCATCLFSFAGCNNSINVGGNADVEINEFGDYDGLPCGGSSAVRRRGNPCFEASIGFCRSL